MANQNQHGSHQQGQVKDPEHDGRLKENRESGHGKGTAERQHEAGHSRGGSQQGGQPGGSHQQHSGRSDDLKSREYRDAQGNVHHHTHTAGKK